MHHTSEHISQEATKYVSQLKQNEDKYMNDVPLKIFCGTYNLNGKTIDESLFSWFCKHEHCDLYVLGFQELCELNTTSFIMSSDWNEREASLLESLKKDLGSKELVGKVRLWGIALFVYARKKLAKYVKDVAYSSVATGILNTLGNKGSVGISMRIYDTRICLLCSHFASDTSQLERRNADYRYTCENLRFEMTNQQNEYLDIDSHSIVFWLGDFNYRIDTLTLNDTLKLIMEADFDKLLRFDQLSRQLNEKRAFLDYKEGSVRFRPTYKYTVKSDVYDMVTNANGVQTVSGRGSSTIKPKLPSWTDRILWKCTDSVDMVQLIQYSSIQTITISDHKPVYGLFNVKLKQIDEVKYRKYFDLLLKESDRKQNEDRPKIKLMSEAEINFGRLSFYQTKTLEISVKNDGLSNVSLDTYVHFVHPRDAKSTLKFEENHFGQNKSNGAQSKSHSTSISTLYNQWFKVKPYKIDSFKPNSIMNIKITVDFNQYNLHRLNRRQHLEDILVIKCLGGNDLFVNIVCDYVPTIMGVSLKGLSTLTQSFDKCNLAELFSQTEEHIKQAEMSVDTLAIEINTHLSNRNKSQTKTKSKFYTSAECTESFLKPIRKQIVDVDGHFENSLTFIYENFVNLLIKKCIHSESGSVAIDDQDNEHTIEESKQDILNLLGSCNFETLSQRSFDFELLIDVLRDLLLCLPVALVPYRFYELCMSSVGSYVECKEVFNLLSTSHLRLFNLLTKFLKTYSNVNNEINYHNIADAVFQILKNKVIDLNMNNSVKKTTSISSCTNNGVLFLKLCVDNYSET